LANIAEEMKNKLFISFFKILGIFLFSFGIFELAITLIFTFPCLAKFGFLDAIRELYNRKTRVLIQMERKYARYDPELGYTLKPGTFLFSNPEFRTRFRVNRLGVRDNKESLDYPEIVVVGDSFAMGWGIKQHETFAERIEALTGLKTLNAAISSYGTVREMRILGRINMKKVKYLVIQYCDNDYIENKAFADNHNNLKVWSRKEYKNIRNTYQEEKRYFFGKYTLFVVDKLFKSIIQNTEHIRPMSDETKDEVEVFINALLNANKTDLRKVKIIIMQFNMLHRGNYDFIDYLEKYLASANLPKYLKGAKLIDVSKVLTSRHYYTLDDHITAEGHKIIADEILKVMDLGGD